ncbi:hypothetical protein AUP74_03214 [Microbulbifer aggregans]|uniref:Uncharacterized protein n=1 Tax=Microbulbifer aggregans TaxID=1769779 RepID=A0A1C9WBR4_9GAMM|nr:glycine zipper 2TM domain-containing protein [Microbulbifer aggregans]AOS98580.1 hypothetical protein AUP74_03214 [Microbulbifer aggregans]
MQLHRHLVIAALLAALASASAQAGDSGYHAGDGYDFARVTDVTPIYRDIQVRRPRTECWEETVAYPGPGSAAGTVIGGLIGAAVGRESGHRRRGRNGRTLAGAAVGAAIGHEISRAGKVRYGTEQRCQVVDEFTTERELVGYDVRYRYNGRHYLTRTDQHPGDRIRVRVDVTPAW